MEYAYSPIMHGLGAIPITPTGVAQSDHPYEEYFEREVRLLLHSEAATSGAHMVWDGDVKKLFEQKVEAFARDIRQSAMRGSLSWQQANSEAVVTRVEVMRALRMTGTPLGRIIEHALAKQGSTLNEIIGKKAIELFGKSTRYDQLSFEQKDDVYGEIVEDASKAGAKFNNTVRRLRHSGRILVAFAIAMAVYNIATKDDSTAAVEQAFKAATGGDKKGAGNQKGQEGGNEVAGLKCNAGAPICVGVGYFVAGALSSFGVSNLW
jgi:hypothetical protein